MIVNVSKATFELDKGRIIVELKEMKNGSKWLFAYSDDSSLEVNSLEIADGVQITLGRWK